jgi:P2 family phage contractile tail tube protein
MQREIPQIIRDMNVFLDGKGYLGTVSAFKLPEIAQDMTESNGPIGAKYAKGTIKAMECSFKVNTLDANTFSAFGISAFNKNKAPFVFKGSLYEDGKSKSVFVVITGDIESISVGELEAGKIIEQEVKMHAQFYSLTVDNKPIILVDVKNTICRIGEVDYLADVRSHLQ